MNLEATTFGFRYGPALVERVASDDKTGWCAIGINTAKGRLIVVVTKSGLVKIQDETRKRKVKK